MASSSITCTTIPRPNNSPISIYTNHHLPPHNSIADFSPPLRKLFPRYSHRRQHRLLPTPRLSVSNTSNPDPYNFQQKARDRRSPTLFPGGYKRPEIKVPTFVLRVNADEVLGSEKCRDRIDVAVAKGVVGIVVLGSDGGGGGGGGRVYEAAGVLKDVIRDRAFVVIEDRVDVAAAVGANGVLLSDQGLPAIVARNMMSKSSSQSVLLPLVARTVQTMENALNASSSEGADFLIISIDSENYAKVVDEFATIDVKIPIFFAVGDKNRADSLDSMAMNLLQFGSSGMVISLDDLNLLCESVIDKTFRDALTVNGRIQGNIPSVKPMHTGTGGKEDDQRKMVAGFTKLEDREVKFIEEEKDVLLDAITIMRRAAPLMEEVSLLVDAIARLDQPFLAVIVGEFNSGKSTVINALLGSRYLKEGVVPTTNEITLLCYSDIDSVDQERCERHPDGQFICYLNAPILKEMNLVDTPGTNVILQRQQRLTEEYVPRADLVLFVLSSDRPLTESEVSFLLYIRQWKKRIVFILNKADLYRNSSELEEAMEFVKANIRTMLNAEHVELYPVSARSAVEAKLSVPSQAGRASEEALLDNLSWVSSGFYELENFLFSFLDGSTATGMERMQLKLETPIAIADRLFAACERHTNQEFELACKDLAAVNELVDSVNNYAIKMESESILWKKQTSLLVETAKTRAIKLLESILQLSNIDLLASYAFRGENSSSTSATASVRSDIISPALSDIQKLLAEYLQWLDSNNAKEVQQYLKSFEKKLPGLISPKTATHPETCVLIDNQDKVSTEIVRNFSASAASRLLDQEIREVVLGTYGGLGVAGLSASLLTSVLPTTLEDLLALALCSAGGFFTISNFPSRRKNAIEKVTKVADALAKEISEAMLEDLSKAIENLRIFVKQTGKPYQEAAQKEIDRLSEIKSELDRVQRRIQALKTDIQNLHVL